MAKDELVEFAGTIIELLPENEHEILAYAAGKMKKHRLRPWSAMASRSG